MIDIVVYGYQTFLTFWARHKSKKCPFVFMTDSRGPMHWLTPWMYGEVHLLNIKSLSRRLTQKAWGVLTPQTVLCCRSWNICSASLGFCCTSPPDVIWIYVLVYGRLQIWIPYYPWRQWPWARHLIARTAMWLVRMKVALDKSSNVNAM